MKEDKKPQPMAQPGGDGRLVSTEMDSPRRLDVGALLGQASEVILVHNGADYRLRITAANKLILTK